MLYVTGLFHKFGITLAALFKTILITKHWKSQIVMPFDNE